MVAYFHVSGRRLPRPGGVDVSCQYVPGISNAFRDHSDECRSSSAHFPAAPSISHAASIKLSKRDRVEQGGQRSEALCCFCLPIFEEVFSVGRHFSILAWLCAIGSMLACRAKPTSESGKACPFARGASLCGELGEYIKLATADQRNVTTDLHCAYLRRRTFRPNFQLTWSTDEASLIEHEGLPRARQTVSQAIGTYGTGGTARRYVLNDPVIAPMPHFKPGFVQQHRELGTDSAQHFSEVVRDMGALKYAWRHGNDQIA